uniref:Uncharacterized protein n=1 Tax=Glossina austeni TaxID=7395 RepID=A0A1A9UYQ2_GLOAU
MFPAVVNNNNSNNNNNNDNNNNNNNNIDLVFSTCYGSVKCQTVYRLVTILKTKLNSKYKCKAVNTWAIPVYIFSFGVTKWNGMDLDKANRTIRAIMYKYNVHHPRSPKVRIYLHRQLGGRGLAYLSSLHDAQVTTLRKYFRPQREYPITEMMKLDRNYTPPNSSSNSHETPNNVLIHHQMLCNWTQNQLHRNHANKKEEDTIDLQSTYEQLIRGELYCETKGFIVARQDEVISTRSHQRHVMNREIETDLCRKCRSSIETIGHIIAGRITFASTAYLNRRNRSAPVMDENENATMYRQIITDRPINANKPDIVVLSWENKAIDIMDVSIPLTQNTQTAYSDKIVKYTELAQEMKGMYNVEKVTITPIVISCAGVAPKTAIKGINYLAIHNTLEKANKAVLLSTATLHRAFLQQQHIQMLE